MKNKSNQKDTDLPQVFWGIKIISQLGFSLIIPLVGGAFLGSYLDEQFGTQPKITLSLILLGLFLGLYSMYKIVKDNFNFE